MAALLGREHPRTWQRLTVERRGFYDRAASGTLPAPPVCCQGRCRRLFIAFPLTMNDLDPIETRASQPEIGQ